MTALNNTTFICLDCETTGLNPDLDQIIEIAAVKFQFNSVLHSFDTLVDPGCPINPLSIAIHHITDDMVAGKPKIQEVLPTLLSLVGDHIIIGHGIELDIRFICSAAQAHHIPCSIRNNRTLDTLRMARLYGDSPTNSLETLRKHFNIPAEGAHRALNDVVINIEVFKFLCAPYKTQQQLFEKLKHPIALKTMPLGRYKGRIFAEIPIEYLLWALHKDFDQDLLFSIRLELNKRKKGTQFHQAANPFSSL
jgi:DNA polymerase-3 subunit epsilon